MRRPALFSAFLFASGIIAARYSGLHYIPAAGCAAFLLLAGVLVRIEWLRGAMLLGALAASAASLFSFHYVHLPKNGVEALLPHRAGAEIYGWVEGQEFSPYGYTRYILSVDSIRVGGRSLPACGSVLVNKKGIDRQARYGSGAIAEGIYRKFRGERNPGELNAAQYYRYRGIAGHMATGESGISFDASRPGGSFVMRKLVAPAKERLTNAILRNFGGEGGHVLLALLLGERGFIEPELNSAFARTGAVHLLAVSGLHTGYVLFLLSIIVSLLRLSGYGRILVIIAGLAYYVLLTGSVPSAFRAAVIGGAMAAAYYLERRADFWNALGFSALVIFIFRPADLFDIGCQLSFAAVSALVIMGGVIKKSLENRRIGEFAKRRRWLFYVASSLIISFGVTVFLFPLTGYYFQRLPLSIIVLNLLLVPLSGLIVGVGFFALLLGYIWQAAAHPFYLSLDFFLTVLLETVEFAGRLPYSSPHIGRSEALIGALICILFAIAVYLYKNRRAGQAVILLFLAANIFIYVKILTHRPPGIDLLTFDVGQGTSVLATLPGGERILFDAGDIRGSYAKPASSVADYLRREGIVRLDKVFISHPDKDHAAGLLPIMAAVAIDTIFLGPEEGKSVLTDIIRRRADSLHIPLKKIFAGDMVSAGAGYRLYILHPSRTWTAAHKAASSNNMSLILKLVMGGSDVLLPGDAEYPAEKAVLDYPEWCSSRILIAGHHGSMTSSSEEFLKAVLPRYAVISAGEDNRYGHPSPITLERLRRIDSEIIRTDLSGAPRFFLAADTLLRTR